MRSQKSLVASLVIVIAGMAGNLSAQSMNPCGCQPAVPMVRGQRGQPISLFDGKTLDGWVHQNGQESVNWVVEDGTLFRKQGGGDLYHQHWWQDFELSLEWKIAPGGNSGVKYRVQRYDQQWLGCEYQLQDDKQQPLNKHATGALYAIHEPTQNKPELTVGEWNRTRIVVCGQHVEHWLNGQKVVDTQIGSLDWLQRVQQSKFRDKAYFGQNREGRIFLQDHGHPVWFRKITIVPLNCGLGF